MTIEHFKQDVWNWAEKIKVRPKEIHIRKMKNKWASCSSRGRLTFDVEVLDLSPQKRNKIIVHELLHLRYPTHNKMFHRMMEWYLKG